MSATKHQTLAFCVAMALGTSAAHSNESAPPPTPSTLTVTNCDDSGPGSLRDALASAASGDTVDLTQLQCSVITLTSGELFVGVDDLSIQGAYQTITAGGTSRVIEHNGVGTLRMSQLVLSDGAVVGVNPAKGGGIRSSGDLYLLHATIQNCSVASVPGFTSRALGGGAYSAGHTTLESSQILGNSVSPGASSYSYGAGGGVYALGGLAVESSTISGNTITGRSAYIEGGGFASQSVFIIYSTISGNSAWSAAGGFIGYDSVSLIRDSTISGNTAQQSTGGLATTAPFLRVWDSTIAFNTAALPSGGGFLGGAGIAMFGSHSYLNLLSTIVAGNSAGGVEDDLAGGAIVGHNNLVLASSFPLPPDTLQVDPMLGPLAGNGGTTETHALLPGSPAIDAGGNEFESNYDQRGFGHPRISGPHADIGAYERFQPDYIFSNGFD